MPSPPEQLLQKPSNLKAYLLLTLTTTCWAMNAILGRLAVDQVSPLALVSLRWLLVVILLLIFAQSHLRRDWAILKNHLLYILVMGAFGFTGFNMLFYLSAHTTTAINIGILQGAIPVFVLMLAFLIFKERVTKLQSIGVAVTIFGVVIIASGGSVERLANLEVNEGDALMLLACALYAGYTVSLRYRPEVSALSFLSMMAVAALLTSIPFTLLEAYMGHFQVPTPTGWAVVIMVALFPSIIAQIAFMTGVRIIGPGRAGVFVNLVPIFASIFAVTFLDEPFELYHGAALALVLFGIWLSERGKPV
ncbi:DMT family transporter [uncultured Sneathiella sp.]|jgi:drug/metabolite transporter (DMT)-like permease|uniref:DMT family transporter n=1 Tax=uncultured Sneathiella sp. TaxID=879315 RepID=UPI0030DBB3FD|tara:strand:+ start:662 stop:1579 length:918 start_codon:yes stop_codon:yes gene_type:complete